MKHDEECIKVSWDSFMDQEQTEQKISPFREMDIQVADMLLNTRMTLNGLEKDFNFAATQTATRVLEGTPIIKVKNRRARKVIMRHHRRPY